jgi:hypothetical protein
VVRVAGAKENCPRAASDGPSASSSLSGSSILYRWADRASGLWATCDESVDRL